VATAPPPDLPEGVIVQSVYATEEGTRSGWRVWDDGRQESRRDDSEWRPGPPLDAAAVADLRAALAEADLPAFAGVHGTPGGRHAGTLWFTAALPEGPATVTLHGAARLEPLERLTERLVPILSGGAL
jgi:hypothetical protein